VHHHTHHHYYQPIPIQAPAPVPAVERRLIGLEINPKKQAYYDALLLAQDDTVNAVNTDAPSALGAVVDDLEQDMDLGDCPGTDTEWEICEDHSLCS